METSTSEKNCQFCAEEILVEANVCKFCHRNQIDDKKTDEMIKSLSINKGLVGNIFFLSILFLFRWWLALGFIFLMIFSINNERENLKKLSKLELLEKYEKLQKYLRGRIFLDILFYIILFILIFTVIGVYVLQTGILN
jgi:small-conductance mechanosensitive channel